MTTNKSSPFTKNAIVSKDNKTVTVFRVNQTTQILFIVALSYDTWREFKKERNVATLQIAELTKEQIDFIAENLLTNEIRTKNDNPIKKPRHQKPQRNFLLKGAV